MPGQQHSLRARVATAIATALVAVGAVVSVRPAGAQPPPIRSFLWMTGGGAVGEAARFTLRQPAGPGQNYAAIWSIAPSSWQLQPPFVTASTGTLDSVGDASFILGVPNVPALEGVLIHVAAAAWVTTYGLAYSNLYLWPIAGRATPSSRPVGRLSTLMTRPTVNPLTDGRFMISGGADRTYTVLSSTVLAYDPSPNALRTLGAMNTARSGHIATQLSSQQVLMLGGTYPVLSAELYDPIANQSRTLTGVPATARPAEGVLVVDPPTNREWVAYNAFANVGLVYDVRLSRFSSLPFGVGRYGSGIAALPGTPEVVFAGGFDGVATTDRVEVYNALTGATRTAGRLNRPRLQSAAIALDGRFVLVVDGADATGRATGDIELFDVATGTSTTLPARLLVPRHNHIAGFDRTGRLRVCGGRSRASLGVNILLEQIDLARSVPLRPLPWLGQEDVDYTFGRNRSVLAVALHDLFLIP